MAIIKLTSKDINMVLEAINNIDEYDSEWDNLWEKISRQARLGKLKKVM